jgi:hypothetical protein
MAQAAAAWSVDALEVAGPEVAGEGGAVGSVEAHVDEPAAAGVRLDPAVFLAGRRGRAEVQLAPQPRATKASLRPNAEARGSFGEATWRS